MAQATNLYSGSDFNEALVRIRQLDPAWQKKAGEGLHVSATKPRVRTECRSLGFRGGIDERSRMFSLLVRRIARRIFLAASLAIGTGLRSWHELILMEAEPLMAGEKLLCPSLNTSVRSAITSSKRSSLASSGRSARSAMRPSLTLSFRGSGFGGSFRVPCPSPKQEPEAAAAYAVGSVPAPL